MPTTPLQFGPSRRGNADPLLEQAAAALRDNRPAVAEALLRRALAAQPGDTQALKLLGDALIRLERPDEAAEALRRCLALAPDFDAARYAYVGALQLQGNSAEAFAQIEELLHRDPGNASHRNLKALAHLWLDDGKEAAAEFEIVLRDAPPAPSPWLNYAHTLRTLGRWDDAVAAYRTVIQRFPRLGEPYWSLANLKTFRFAESEIAAMRALLQDSALPDESRTQILFALGKALEDEADYGNSFARYSEANALRRATMRYTAESTSALVRNSMALFTPEFFTAREGWGCPAPDPIFIVGLPRSGSTLLEQILASHSAIEGTMELRAMRHLVDKLLQRGIPYPEVVGSLTAGEARALGEDYLSRARIHRKTDRPFFIDKMPLNWQRLGLIRLILPNAKIVDARRHPLACCFSCFKQHFPGGDHFSYELGELGRFYADYVRLMAHVDAVLPGYVHRVFYERMIAEPEAEVRRLLDALGLPFEPQCLRFYENERPVRSASSEQVRMPLFSDSLEQWRHYEPWLAPLKQALGPVLEGYPAD